MPNDKNQNPANVQGIITDMLGDMLAVIEKASKRLSHPGLSLVPDIPAEVEEPVVVELPVPPVPDFIKDVVPTSPETLDEAIDQLEDEQAKVTEVPADLPVEVEIETVEETEEVPTEVDPPIIEVEEMTEAEGDDIDWDMDDMDDAEEPATDPELDYLRADAVLNWSETRFHGVTDPVRMYEVDSSHVLKIGRIIKQKAPEFCTMYTMFKGENLYRYGPTTVKTFQDILSEGVRKAEGRPEASVGSIFHHLVKADADKGDIKCQRFEAESKMWVLVPAKAERVKAVKTKHGK